MAATKILHTNTVAHRTTSLFVILIEEFGVWITTEPYSMVQTSPIPITIVILATLQRRILILMGLCTQVHNYT